MAKYKGRATRLGEAMGTVAEVISKLEEIKDDESLKDAEKVKQSNDAISGVDVSEVESLAEEMGSWRDNMQGTNLESTDKYSRVEECADTLETISSDLQDVGEINEADEIDSVIDSLQNAVDEASGVDFPGMFG